MSDQTAQNTDPFAYPTGSSMSPSSTPVPAVTPTVPIVQVQMPATPTSTPMQAMPTSDVDKNRAELEALVKRQEAGNAQEQPIVMETPLLPTNDIPVPLPPMPTVTETPVVANVAPVMPTAVIAPKEPPMPENPIVQPLPVLPVAAPVVNPMPTPTLPNTNWNTPTSSTPTAQEPMASGSNDARIAKLEKEMTELRQQLAKLSQTVSQWV